MAKIELTPIPAIKTIALIAHDNKKQEMIKWCKKNADTLKKHNLVGTGTTASVIAEFVGLEVSGYNSGPLGGDQQVGAKIAEGKIDLVIFFSDPLAAHPHEPDVRALSRLSNVFDVPMANNEATADFLISSPLMDLEYPRDEIVFTR